MPVTEQVSDDLVLPEPESDKMIAWNKAADQLELKSADEILNLTGALAIANNLSDLASVPTALVNLGIDPFTIQLSDAILDSQTNTDLTGWTLDAASYSSAMYLVEVQRSTTIFSNHFVFLKRKNGVWDLEESLFVGDDPMITFSVSEAGGVAQVRYTSDASGTGTIKWKRVSLNV